MNIAIIGSGIGGLSSAIRLVKKGHSVDIFERNTCEPWDNSFRLIAEDISRFQN